MDFIGTKRRPCSLGRLMWLRDIRKPTWLYIKGALMLVVGVLASVMLLFEHWSLRTAALLAIAVWGFCRAYYFAFYVIQHYADSNYRFAGLWSFCRYIWTRRGPV